MVLHHRLELQGPTSPCPYPFVASSPSKDRLKSGFPKHDVGSWLRRAALPMDLGARCLLGRDVT